MPAPVPPTVDVKDMATRDDGPNLLTIANIIIVFIIIKKTIAWFFFFVFKGRQAFVSKQVANAKRAGAVAVIYDWG